MAQVGFGKHRHRSWESVVDTDHQYVEWALEKLDVVKFDIPDHILDLYLEKFRNDTKAKEFVDMWKARKEKHRGQPTPASRCMTREEVLDIPVNSVESTLAFEYACVDAFGKFPFNRWDY